MWGERSIQGEEKKGRASKESDRDRGQTAVMGLAGKARGEMLVGRDVSVFTY